MSRALQTLKEQLIAATGKIYLLFILCRGEKPNISVVSGLLSPPSVSSREAGKDSERPAGRTLHAQASWEWSRTPCVRNAQIGGAEAKGDRNGLVQDALACWHRHLTDEDYQGYWRQASVWNWIEITRIGTIAGELLWSKEIVRYLKNIIWEP